MTTREFIKNLGDDAAEFFGSSPQTIARWLRTGSVPLKAVDKIHLAMRAAQAASQEVIEVSIEDAIDPVTKLPVNIRRGLPALQGQPPAFIEEDPREQSFGINLTRPGRLPQPKPPMKIKIVDGVKIPYVDNNPKTPHAMPPTIATDNTWATPLERPEPKKD